MSEQREALAEALDYLTDMARGHDYADDRKISEARDTIEDALVDAERGADRVAAAVESPDWAKVFLSEWSRPYFGEDSSDAVAAVVRAARAALATGAADRVRAEEGGDRG